MTSKLWKMAGAASLLVLSIILLASAGVASDITIIRTAAQMGTEPKYVADRQLGVYAISGLCVDVKRAIERVDPTIRFVGDQDWQPAIRIEQQLDTGDLDAACGFTRTSARTRLFFIEPPIFEATYHLVVRADDFLQVNQWDDVRKLGLDGVILTVHGFGPVTRLRELGGLHIDAGAADARTNLLKLVAGRGRFFYHRSPGLATEIRNTGMEDVVRILPAVMDRQSFYMVVSPRFSPQGRSKLAAAMAELRRAGTLEQIIRKWLNE